MTRNTGKNSLLIGAALLALGAGEAHARDGARDEAGRGGDVIVVTAQKREQRLRDVPLSVSAISTEELENNGIENFEDFARQLPGVNLTQAQRNRAQITIRGISTGNPGISRSQDEVATYIDEMPLNGRFFAGVTPDLRLFDIERVEVLRGPQGTLFGSGSLGGAVRVITNKPDASDYDAAMQVDLGRTEGGAMRSRYSGMVNIPLVEDELAVRAVGYYRDEEGWLTNIGTGQKHANTTQDWGGRIALKWTPSEDLDITLLALRQVSNPEDGDQFDPSTGKFLINSPAPTDREARLSFYNASINYDMGFAALTSSTTFAQSDEKAKFAFTFLTDISGLSTFDSDFFSQEVRLASQSDGPLSWVVGGLFFDQSGDRNESNAIIDVAAAAAQFNLTGVPADGTIGEVPSKLDAQEIAGFGELSYRVTDTITLTGGLRYSDYEMHFDSYDSISYVGGFVTAALSGGGDITTIVPPTFFDQQTQADSSSWTGKASFSWQPDDDQHYYFLAARGYRVGQANTVFGPDPVDPVNGLFIPEQFDPDSLWNYELGAKLSLFGDMLRTNIALYYIDWTDIQISGGRTTDFVSFVGNAGQAVSKGIELESWVFPAEGLTLGFNLTLQDAEIKNISAADSDVTGALEGDPLPNSPDFQVAGFVEYQRPISSGWDMFARADVQHVGSFKNGFSNTAGAPGVPNGALATTDAYENVNFSLGLQSDNWRLTAYVENLTNNDDFIRVEQNILFANRFNTLRPRTVGLRVQFGL